MHPGARGGGYGLDADLANKSAAKMDQNADAFEKAQSWIEQVIGRPFPEDFGSSLKDGTILCELLNCIKPGCIKANTSTMPFKQMENVSNYLKVSRALGVKQHDCFETVDLYEQKDLLIVALQIHALGSAIQISCPDYGGPVIGVKIAEKNVRTFTPEQIIAQKANSGMTLQNAGSAGIMERTQLNTSNDINFANKMVGTGSSEMSAQTMGSAGIMQRGAINVSNDINFGAKSAGTGSSLPTAQTMGSAGIMQRTGLDVRNDINFGAKASGTGSSVPTAQTMGSQGVMQRSEVNVSNDINFGAKQAGEATIFDGMSKIAIGSSGVMQRSEVSTSNNINFGAQQQGAELNVEGSYEPQYQQEEHAEPQYCQQEYAEPAYEPAEEPAYEAAPAADLAYEPAEEPAYEAERAEDRASVVKALYDYVPAEEGELSFSAGEEITVTHKDESGWWTGTNSSGASGVFPANYTDGA